MEAQGPDVDRAIERRRGIFLSTFNYEKSEDGIRKEKERLAKLGLTGNAVEDYIKRSIKLYGCYVTFPVSKYLRIENNIVEGYNNDTFHGTYKKFLRDRVSQACSKVVGMSLDLYMHEFASDEGFHIPPDPQGVITYHMQMIVGCQKHGFYEKFIPTILTMIYFGKHFTTLSNSGSDLNVGMRPGINYYDTNSVHTYYSILDTVYSSFYYRFSIDEWCMRYEEPVVTMFEAKLVIMEAELERKALRNEFRLRGPFDKYEKRYNSVGFMIESAKDFLTA